MKTGEVVHPYQKYTIENFQLGFKISRCLTSPSTSTTIAGNTVDSTDVEDDREHKQHPRMWVWR